MDVLLARTLYGAAAEHLAWCSEVCGSRSYYPDPACLQAALAVDSASLTLDLAVAEDVARRSVAYS